VFSFGFPWFPRAALWPSVVNLGAWQLSRADEKRQEQQRRESVNQQSHEWRGEFLADKTVFLDNRSRQGVAGLYVLTPLKITQGDSTAPHILVLRGWVARPRGEHQQLPAIVTPNGEQVIKGLSLPNLGKAPWLSPAQVPALGKAWAHVDLSDYAKISGLQLMPLVVRQFNELPDSLKRDWPADAVDVNKHLGYAFQWFSLAFLTLSLWLYFYLIRPMQKTERKKAQT
jgi:surfeit locus 1 family protein